MKLEAVLLFFFATSVLMNAQRTDLSYTISNPEVNVMLQDSDGYLWVGTRRGLNRYNGTNYSIFYASGDDGHLANDEIHDMMIDSYGVLWVGTDCGVSSLRYGEIRNYPENAAYKPTLRLFDAGADSLIVVGLDDVSKMQKNGAFASSSRYPILGTFSQQCVAMDNMGKLWLVYTFNGSTVLDILDPSLHLVKRHNLRKDGVAYALEKMQDGRIILATEYSFLCYDPATMEQVASPSSLLSLKNSVGGRSLFIKQYDERRLLVGIANRGLFLCDIHTDGMTQIDNDERLDQQSYACYIDKDNGIWLSDEDDGLRYISPRSPYRSMSRFEDGMRMDVSALCFDKEGLLWTLIDSRIVCVNPANGKRVWTLSPTSGYTSFSIDPLGRLWSLRDRSIIDTYAVSGGRLTLVRSLRFPGNINSMDTTSDSGAIVSIGDHFAMITQQGDITETGNPFGEQVSKIITDPLSRRTFLLPLEGGIIEWFPNGRFQKYDHEMLKNIRTVTAAQDGSLWVGTFNNGVLHYDPSGDVSDRFGISDGLLDSGIEAIVEDYLGNIWFSTFSRITKYDTDTKMFSVIHDSNFGDNASYSTGCVGIGPGGKIFFGGGGGIDVIDPNVIIPHKEDIPLGLETLIVNGKTYSNHTESLDLDYRHNMLSFRFAGLNFEGAPLLNYSYKMDGYESEWQYCKPSNIMAVYTYLPPGKYTFRARVRELSGLWSKNEICIPVVIRPAPWNTLAAKIGYFILFGLAMAFIIILVSRFRLQKEKASLAEQRETMKQQHIDYVTNVSHELRSPLSMVYGPAKELMKYDLSDEEMVLVSAIERNAEKLRSLSDQILSSGLGANDPELLHIRQNDLASVVRNICNNYRFASIEKEVTITRVIPEGCIGYFDTEKVSRITSNLLSNAIKYTNKGGNITVRVRMLDGNMAEVSVADDGIGIPEGKLGQLFERGKRLGAEDSMEEGYGIGLNYAHSLAEKHKGNLIYTPNMPRGSIFTLTIPVSRTSYSEVDRAYDSEMLSFDPKPFEFDARRSSILVVEDSTEIRNFLYGIFSQKYNVFLASNGAEALDHLGLSVPDIIISDVIMPIKNGYSLCSDIKGNGDWCHIPVLLLTARADALGNIEGMRCGADAYVPKPFDPDVLMATVDSLLRNRKAVQARLANLTSTSLKDVDPVENGTGLTKKEKELMARIHAIMDQNLDNPSFSVEMLSEFMNMSYSSLYSKLKAIMGVTPLQFINTYRMNMAMEYLSAGSYTVSEVALKVGQESLSTFSRDFKKHFGIPPSKVGDLN